MLAPLPEVRLRALWSGSLPRGYQAGEVIRCAGQPAEHLLLLLRGRVSAGISTAAGRVVRFGDWAGPCALDKIAVIDGRGHTATLTATSDCAVRSLPRARFEQLVDDVPAVRRHVLRLLAGQARYQQGRFADAATMSPETRLVTWLLEHSAHSTVRTPSGPGIQIELPGTQQEFADLLGTTRVTVNRVLSRLRREGLIQLTRRRVTLLAPELLALRVREG
jgi:CRP/FNR family transcriptional regulator, cyclic AMP receptor protein